MIPRVDSRSEYPSYRRDAMIGCQDNRFKNGPIEFMTDALALNGRVKEGLGAEIGLVPELGNHHRAPG